MQEPGGDTKNIPHRVCMSHLLGLSWAPGFCRAAHGHDKRGWDKAGKMARFAHECSQRSSCDGVSVKCRTDQVQELIQ
eukprot:5949103-Amphidinium_carterae.1